MEPQTIFPEHRVPEDAVRQEEPLGTKFKFWFHTGDESWLFKRGRTGEDWSEKVAAELAHVLGIPAARVELARTPFGLGTVSQSFLAPGDILFHGNELLVSYLGPEYPAQGRYHVGMHTLEAAAGALQSVGAQAIEGLFDFPADAVDQLVGYFMLDVLIGNTDRHHENWAVVERRGRRWLAPSYDHASSLGRNERSAKLEQRLSGHDRRMSVESFAVRCRSAFYRGSKALTTFELWQHAAALRPKAAAFWRARLLDFDPAQAEAWLAAVPEERISKQKRMFAAALLKLNRERVLG